MSARGPALVAAILLVCGAVPRCAAAAVVRYIDLGDTVVVQDDGGFDCFITNTVNGESVHTTACVNLGGPCGNCSGAGDAFIVEPAGAAHPGAISDRVHINVVAPQGAQAFYTIDFVSDDDNAPPSYPPAGYPLLVENGQLQLVNDYFRDSPGGDGVPFPGNVEIWLQSDIADKPTSARRKTWSAIKTFYR